MRDHYETKDAMFTNSLFCDFLINNGMRILKDDYTKDIICLEFNYGSRSYEAELTHLNKVARNARNQYRLAKVKHDAILMERSKNKVDKITELLKEAYKNRNQYKRMNTAEIRKLFYNEGVTINYVTTKKDGEENVESIHYKMLYRSTGKAKKGSCMFIRDRLYERAHKFLYMGIEQDPDNPMIVEISAYAPLVSSSIVDRVRINPNNILILKDVDRSYTTNVVSVETDENQHCIARAIEDYRLKNTLFDGQALIDSSLFPSWGNGYILLRQHFFKAAAFCCDIQEVFRDYFGEDYYYATVKDYWGNVHYLKDIELITTDNACKWMKFDVSYQYWCKKVFQNNCMFGIVKTAHESKLGEMQRMS